MASIIELIIWLTLAIITFYGFILGKREYQSRKLSPFAIISAINLCLTVYAISYFIGRIIGSPIIILFGFFWVNITLLLNVWFFRHIFGGRRDYEILHMIQICFSTLAMVSSIMNFPILTESDIIFPIGERIGLMGSFLCFILIAVDYCVFCIKQIKIKELSFKLLLFPYALIFGMILTLSLYVFTIIGIFPLFISLIPVLLSFVAFGVILSKYPANLFIAPLEPIHFDVVKRDGIPLFSYAIEKKIEQNYINSIISAMDSTFTHFIDLDARLKYIRFENLICYVEFRENFFVVFIDHYFSPFVQKKMELFTEEIEPKVNNKLTDWDGDMRVFNSIEKEFQKHFYFLPNFLKNN